MRAIISYERGQHIGHDDIEVIDKHDTQLMQAIMRLQSNGSAVTNVTFYQPGERVVYDGATHAFQTVQ